LEKAILLHRILSLLKGNFLIIFLDESGDLGFDFSKPKTSKKFVITLLVCDGKETTDGFRKAVRRTLKNKLNNRNRGRVIRELKGTGTTLTVKSYFYRNLSLGGWRLYTVVLNKQQVYDALRKPHTKKKLYNFLARFILEQVDLSQASPAVTLVTDLCKNREEIRDFNAYLANQPEALLPLNIPLNIYMGEEEAPYREELPRFFGGNEHEDIHQ
jgi:hypothetical protein